MKKKRCVCGCDTFVGKQVQHTTIQVDECGYYIQDLDCYCCEDHFGPYQCYSCGAEYDEWKDIPDKTQQKNRPSFDGLSFFSCYYLFLVVSSLL